MKNHNTEKIRPSAVKRQKGEIWNCLLTGIILTGSAVFFLGGCSVDVGLHRKKN